MPLNLPLIATVFFSNWVISGILYENLTHHVQPEPSDKHPTHPFLIKEPMGPKSNGPLRLERLDNMDSEKWDVQLNLEWQYESSAVEKDRRIQDIQDMTQNHASLRFIFETYNHDGWVIFG